MKAPDWIASAVREFGRGAGIGDFSLNDRGAAAFRFESGVSLRFEYREGELAVAVAVPCGNDPATARRILACAHPDARFGAPVRAGWLSKSSAAAFAVRLPDQEVTLPVLNAVFNALWRAAAEFGGGAWA